MDPMPSKATKRVFPKRDGPSVAKESVRIAPIEEADLSEENIAALRAAAERLKSTPVRAFSKDEIRQHLKKIKTEG